MSSKTVIIKAAATGLGKSSLSQYNPITGRTTIVQQPLTQWEIFEFNSQLANERQKLYAAIKPMLAKGGFEFEPSLWKWEVRQPDQYRLEYWVTITFLDPYGDYTKDEFMGFIRQTGILNYDFKIVKPWG